MIGTGRKTRPSRSRKEFYDSRDKILSLASRLDKIHLGSGDELLATAAAQLQDLTDRVTFQLSAADTRR
jgi:hypothetical protein